MTDDQPQQLFPFYMHEKAYIDELILLARSILREPTLPPGEIRSIARLILALSRLPLPTPGILIGLSFIIEFGNQKTWRDISIDETSLCLGMGQHVYDPLVGGDTESDRVYEISIDGYRTKDDDGITLGDWICGVKRILKDKHRISIEDESDDGDFDWCENLSGTLWDRMKDKY
jgi:hypothetical protein